MTIDRAKEARAMQAGFDGARMGVKDDLGKLRAGLVLGDFSLALGAVIEVGTKGAMKYSPHGWLEVERGFERYTDAMFRHWLLEFSEDRDPELDVLHAAQVAWNALARLELLLRGRDLV